MKPGFTAHYIVNWDLWFSVTAPLERNEDQEASLDRSLREARAKAEIAALKAGISLIREETETIEADGSHRVSSRTIYVTNAAAKILQLETLLNACTRAMTEDAKTICGLREEIRRLKGEKP